jgi:hypothetical protein
MAFTDRLQLECRRLCRWYKKGTLRGCAGLRRAQSPDKNAIPNNANGSLSCYTILLATTYNGFLGISGGVAQIAGACPQNLSEISVTVFWLVGLRVISFWP